MITGVSTIDTMVAVGIHLHIELLVQLYQMFCVFCTVLEVNIVISHTMHQQEVSVQLIGTGESGGTFIASAFSLGVRMKRSPYIVSYNSNR